MEKLKTNEQILKKAIEKAVKGGFDWFQKRLIARGGNHFSFHVENELLPDKHYYQLIFSHDFAIAFWGEETALIPRGNAWQFHLQQMVLEEEPLKYLERFLDDKD